MRPTERGATLTGMSSPAAPNERSGFPARTALGLVGIILQLLVGFPYLVSGLIVPGPYLFGLWLLWFAFMGVAVWLLRHRPPLVPLVAVAALATWFGLLALGTRFLHWTG